MGTESSDYESDLSGGRGGDWLGDLNLEKQTREEQSDLLTWPIQLWFKFRKHLVNNI